MTLGTDNLVQSFHRRIRESLALANPNVESLHVNASTAGMGITSVAVSPSFHGRLRRAQANFHNVMYGFTSQQTRGIEAYALSNVTTGQATTTGWT